MQKPLCFVLMPFGKKPGAGAAVIDFDAVYGELIKPAVEAAGLVPLRADEEQAGGIIYKPMFERLILCEYAVADLTTANAMSPADFSKYPRDLTGYGRDPPDPRWPGGARIAVQFVVNYEEGGERNILHGDATSEAFLSDVPVTVFGVASALARSPEAVAAMREARWEIASHGLKWIDYKDVPEKEERAHLAEAIRVHTQATGERPLGWYTGRTSVNTLKAVLDEGGFFYSSDSYADDLPYWVNGPKGPHLIIPYTLDANDMRFVNAQGFGGGDEFFTYLKDAFDLLYAEGERTALPAGRTPGARGGAHAFSRLCRRARAGVARQKARHRASLASRTSLARRCRPDDPVARHDEGCARKPQCSGRGRLHDRAGRCVRARAVGGASRV